LDRNPEPIEVRPIGSSSLSDESASVGKVYEVLGDVVAFLANPEPPQSGINLFFTIYGQTE
jgi:hypothetical protein